MAHYAGTPPHISPRRDIQDRTPKQAFERVASSLPIEILWAQAPECGAVLEGPPGALAAIEVANGPGGTLLISSPKGFHADGPVVARLSSPRLSGLDLSGSCSARLCGSPALGSFAARLSGAASATLPGHATQLTAVCDGRATLDARQLSCPATSAELSGSSEASFVLSGSATAKLSGSSQCSVLGAGSLVASLSGSSSLSHGGGGASPCILDASGASSAEVVLHGDGCVIRASGASDIGYRFESDPRPVDISRTGAAKVSQRKAPTSSARPSAPTAPTARATTPASTADPLDVPRSKLARARDAVAKLLPRPGKP